jgi:endonuclease/exonuclease/phosphatase family metal-dependent hydrolase
LIANRPGVTAARRAALGAAAMLLALAGPAHALRVVTWNLLQYPDLDLAGRQPKFRTVMADINADVLIVQELQSAAARDSMLNNVLNVVEPGQWTGSGFFTLQSNPVLEGGAVFWKPAKVSVGNLTTFVTSGPRDVLAARITPVGYTALPATFRIYSVHLKAGGPATADSTTRRLECTDIRNTLNVVPAGTNFLLGGDTNIYGAYEGAYLRLTESQSDNDGRGKDPLTMPGNWHSLSGYAPYYSQCPCNAGCGAGFSGGGLDDRFDLFLSSYGMQDGQGLDVVPGGYFAYGNDGLHFNDDVNGGGFNNAVGLTIATALVGASDHLPVVCTVQLASKIAAASQIDFGSAIVGGTAQRTLAVSNPATPPADALDYSMAAPANFTAPGGGFSAAAGAAASNHTLGMSSLVAGTKTGTLTVTTDAPDSLSKTVKLSGLVLAHATASLDSLALVRDDSLDFGARAAADFRDSLVFVHDEGYGALVARLAVNAGVIAGGGGHFSIVGGFQSALVAGAGAAYPVRFDPAGATLDSTYDATLTFSTSDEALPGAAAQPDLVLHLVARAVAGTTAVAQGSEPQALRFAPARPNPLTGETRLGIDLPQAAQLSIAVFDLSGRRIANIADGAFDAGHHDFSWRARDARGVRVAAGLYFARIVTPGLRGMQRLVVLP